MSDTHGADWTIGAKLPAHGESQAVELANGSVVMQMRHGKHAYAFWWCRSDTGGASFEAPCLTRATPLVPDVPTSILRRGGQLLLSHPNSARPAMPMLPSALAAAAAAAARCTPLSRWHVLQKIQQQIRDGRVH